MRSLQFQVFPVGAGGFGRSWFIETAVHKTGGEGGGDSTKQDRRSLSTLFFALLSSLSFISFECRFGGLEFVVFVVRTFLCNDAKLSNTVLVLFCDLAL